MGKMYSRNSKYNDNRTCKEYFCKECPIKISYKTALYGSGLCKSCCRKGAGRGCSGKHYNIGANHGRFIGHTKTKKGYILIYIPNHSLKQYANYMFEHRLVMEKKLGRCLKPGEIVHHLNGIKDDNRPENLCVVTNETHDKQSYVKQLQNKIREQEKIIRGI